MSARRVAFLALAALLGLAALAVSADPVYRWVDKDGKVHYTQTPPPSTGVQAQALNIHAPPPDPVSLRNAQQEAQAIDDKNKADQEAADKAKPDPAAVAAKKQQCDDLHQRLLVLQQSARAATTDAQGNLTFLDDDAKAKQEQAIQDQIAKNCSGS